MFEPEIAEKFECPEAEFHGNPFNYCPVKGCGWIKEDESRDNSLSSEEMIQEVYVEMKRIRELLESYQGLIGPAVEGLMSSPMLKMFFGGNNG